MFQNTQNIDIIGFYVLENHRNFNRVAQMLHKLD